MPDRHGPSDRLVPPRHRLFFALVPGAGLRERFAAAASELRERFEPEGNWTRPARFHVTLRFLGEAPELRDPWLRAALDAGAAVRQAGFGLVFDHAASFPGPRPPWVLRCREPADAIRRLGQALSVPGVAAGLGTAQDFVPHLTVLRHADRALPVTPIEPIDWRVADFALLHSLPGAAPAYQELGRWTLAGS
jgi:2'-5' RNA ligase